MRSDGTQPRADGSAFVDSIVYLIALFSFLLADHWLAAPVVRVGGYVLQRIG